MTIFILSLRFILLPKPPPINLTPATNQPQMPRRTPPSSKPFNNDIKCLKHYPHPAPGHFCDDDDDVEHIHYGSYPLNISPSSLTFPAVLACAIALTQSPSAIIINRAAPSDRDRLVEIMRWDQPKPNQTLPSCMPFSKQSIHRHSIDSNRLADGWPRAHPIAFAFICPLRGSVAGVCSLLSSW